ncbi:biotin transporter BioY [Denitrobacterium detoxificans]|jgi:biotin transport system substrate-specific component|uniref:biotin transporter BioY n=1 Tax=Denitrobacterium detoxificans TaxID=79604 RepID=UPI0026EE0BE2|nr:biotin transporter BioY [Denitrobacterium detoxificans]MBE6466298.1 biotin transporter BioY [Denitrobacterium detoxificans]
MQTRSSAVSRTRSIAFAGLSVALLAVSAWITVPLGPVPFTMQTFVIVFLLLALKPSESLSAIAAYLVLGGIGLPLFSGMKGGMVALLGPTGGFLWSFFVAAAVAIAFLRVTGKRSIVFEYVAAAIYLVISYAMGWFWLMTSTGMSAESAFVAAVAPFIVIDIIKIVLAVPAAHAVRKAVTDKVKPQVQAA